MISHSRDEFPFRQRQQGIAASLKSQGSAGLAAHTSSTGRAGEMGGVDFQHLREAEHFVVQTLVQLFCACLHLTGKVWPTDRADEQGVSGEQEPRLWSTSC